MAMVEALTRRNDEVQELSDSSLDDDLPVEPRENPKLSSLNDSRVSGTLYVVRHEESVGNVAKLKWIADGQPTGWSADNPIQSRRRNYRQVLRA